MPYKKKSRICIVEPCHSHEEVLFPLIELLHEHYDLHVVAPQSLLDVDLLRETSQLYHACAFTVVSRRNFVHRAMDRFFNYFTIHKIIKEINPEVVIFNSTYTIFEVALILWLFRNDKKIQIIHNFQQFLMPPLQWFYRAFDANIVISEQVHQYVIRHHRQFSDLEYFLPIFFDSFITRSKNDRACSHEITHPCLKLGVFGTMEDDRRNCWGLLNAVKKLKPSFNKAGYQIYLVGKAPEKVQNFVKEHHLENIVTCFTGFVPFSKMFQLIAEMDIVLFLIDRDVKNSMHYNRYKISGTSTLMKAFKKAGACSTDFLVDESLADNCFYYPGSDIESLLKQINDGTITAEAIRRKTVSYAGQSEFSFSRQQAKLVSIIQRVARPACCC